MTVESAARALVNCLHEKPTLLVVVRETSAGGHYEDEMLSCPKCGAVYFGQWLQPDLVVALRGALEQR
jgi:hypothetical protein